MPLLCLLVPKSQLIIQRIEVNSDAAVQVPCASPESGRPRWVGELIFDIDRSMGVGFSL